MTRFSLAAFGALLIAGSAQALETLPESCRGDVSGAAYMSHEETLQAELQCDLDRADVLVSRADKIFVADPEPLVRIVDTAAPSGAAYIYDILDAAGTMMLDARTVPAESDVRVPMCRLCGLLGRLAGQSEYSGKVMIMI